MGLTFCFLIRLLFLSLRDFSHWIFSWIFQKLFVLILTLGFIALGIRIEFLRILNIRRRMTLLIWKRATIFDKFLLLFMTELDSISCILFYFILFLFSLILVFVFHFSLIFLIHQIHLYYFFLVRWNSKEWSNSWEFRELITRIFLLFDCKTLLLCLLPEKFIQQVLSFSSLFIDLFVRISWRS